MARSREGSGAGAATSFGALLRSLRRQQGLTQGELARAVGYSAAQVSRLERDQRLPDPRSVEALFGPALGLSSGSASLARLLELARAARGQGEGEPPSPAPILLTRLYRPRPRPGLVARPRLLQRLNSALAAPLTVLIAPAGWGKTSALAEWLQAVAPDSGAPATHQRPRLAWLSLDAADNEPLAFLRYMVAALAAAAPGAVDTASLLLSLPQPPAPEAIVRKLLNDLAGLDEALLLALDDYHLISAPAVHQAMALMLERLPPRVHLVLASRTVPPLPLSRLRARGQLVEVGTSELRFTPDEAAAFLSGVMGLRLSDEQVATVEARTEGWAAGLQLAGLVLRGGEPQLLLPAVAGSHQFVADYLADEVLNQLPSHLRRALIYTSVLERLCGPLCDAVLEAAHAGGDGAPAPIPGQLLLEELERRNLFLVPLDAERRWYRYHHMFAELLQARLRAEARPELETQLRRSAALWFDQAGLLDEALRQALDAGDHELAAALVASRAAAMIERGELVPLRRWLDALPAQAVRASPRLAIAAAMVAVASGDEQLGAELLRAARSAPTVAAPADWLDRTAEAAALVEATLARATGDAARTRALAYAALEAAVDDPFLGGWARWELGTAALQLGAVGEARATFAALLAETPLGFGGLRVQAAAALGRIAHQQGTLHDARRTYRLALEQAGRSAGRAVGQLRLGLASLAYAQGDLAGAAEQARAALDLGAEPPNALLLMAGSARLGRIALAQGDPAAARAHLRVVETLSGQLLQPYLLDLLLDEVVQSLLGAGLADSARALVPPSTPNASVIEMLATSRLALHSGDGALAERSASTVVERATAQGLHGVALEALLVWAQARHLNGEYAAPLLLQALQIAMRAEIVQPFRDALPVLGATLAQLVREHSDSAVRAFIGRVLLAERGGAGAPQALVEPLTPREREVLRMVVAGHSNGEIAEALTIAPGTVKRHVHSLFAKLEATSRTNLVARARDRGLA